MNVLLNMWIKKDRNWVYILCWEVFKPPGEYLIDFFYRAFDRFVRHAGRGTYEIDAKNINRRLKVSLCRISYCWRMSGVRLTISVQQLLRWYLNTICTEWAWIKSFFGVQANGTRIDSLDQKCFEKFKIATSDVEWWIVDVPLLPAPFIFKSRPYGFIGTDVQFHVIISDIAFLRTDFPQFNEISPQIRFLGTVRFPENLSYRLNSARRIVGIPLYSLSPFRILSTFLFTIMEILHKSPTEFGGNTSKLGKLNFRAVK